MFIDCMLFIITVLNFTVDWIIAGILAEQGEGIGKVRYIMKSGLKYFPHYGFACYQVRVDILATHLSVVSFN